MIVTANWFKSEYCPTLVPSKSADTKLIHKVGNKIKPINLRQSLNNYLYHWPLFFLFLAFLLLLATIYTKVVSPTYELHATILVKDEKKTNDEKSPLQEIDQVDQPKIAESEVEIIGSRKLVKTTVEKLQLWVDYTMGLNYSQTDLYGKTPVKFVLFTSNRAQKPFIINVLIKDGQHFALENENNTATNYVFNQPITSAFGKWALAPSSDIESYIGKKITIKVTDPDAVAEKYQQTMQISLANKLAPAISLSLTEKNQLRGLDFLDTLISVYNQSAVAEENKLNRTTLDFINKRLDSLVLDLNNAERAVTDFKSKRGLTDITSESKVYLENVQTNDAKLNDVNVQLNVISGIENYINSPQNQNNPPATLGITDPTLSASIDKLVQLQLQKERLLSSVPEGNPMIEPVIRQIKSIKSTISNSIKTIKASLLSQKQELESFNSRFESSIKNIPGQEREFVNVKRQQDIKNDLYVYLLQKKEELSLKYASTVAEARVVDNAYVARIVWPQKALILAVAFIFGLLIPLFIIYIRDQLKNKVRTKADIEEELALKVFGEVPSGNMILNQAPDISANNSLNEQIRSIRTKLINLYNPNVKGKIFLITSSLDNEGKSFITANLSYSFAFYGLKVLTIEMDLRRPKLGSIFDIGKASAGLSDYLSSNGSPAELTIKQSGTFPNLHVITSGSPVNNPAEILGNGRMTKLLEHLRQQYDVILIDTPPAHLVTDAMVVSAFTDLTLYVIRQNITRKSELNFVREVIEQNQLKNVQVLFNGIEKGRFGYESHYSSKYYNQKDKLAFGASLKKFATRF